MLPHLTHAKFEFGDDLATLPDGYHQHIWHDGNNLRRVMIEISSTT